MSYPNVMKSVGLAVVLVLSVWNAQASECMADDDTRGAQVVGKPDSWAITRQQAANTWDDWVWRGPSFYCNNGGGGGGKCTYLWSKANTTTYQWTVGININLGVIPVIGGALSLIGPNGSYSQSKSYTETFGWNQDIMQGYYAQPVQVIRRRWVSGDFRGANVRTNSACLVNGYYGAAGHRYEWDGNRTFGSWTGNIEVTRFGMYHIWK